VVAYVRTRLYRGEYLKARRQSQSSPIPQSGDLRNAMTKI
jgi:hypothetical protein